jgi:hypothetical protein
MERTDHHRRRPLFLFVFGLAIDATSWPWQDEVPAASPESLTICHGVPAQSGG